MHNKDYFGVIYKATNNINGKVYIGQTTQNFYKRKWSHESRAKNHSDNMPFHKALYKYGIDNFIWDILESCNSKEELNEMEFHYIKQFNSMCPDGYNITFGGEGAYGFKHSKDTCELIRKLKTGKKLSKESISKRSYKQSYTWMVIYPDGREEIILNLSKFCKDNDLNASTLAKVSNGFRNHHKGFKCVKISDKRKVFSDKAKQAISIANKGKKLTIEQIAKRIESQIHSWEIYSIKDDTTIEVKNLKEFCRQNNIHYSSMLRVSRGDRTHHKGFKCRKITPLV